MAVQKIESLKLLPIDDIPPFHMIHHSHSTGEPPKEVPHSCIGSFHMHTNTYSIQYTMYEWLVRREKERLVLSLNGLSNFKKNISV